MIYCDDAVPPRGQLRMILVWPRPLTGEGNPYERGESRRYAAMTRCLPEARCGWFWPGPDPLRERGITTVCCDGAVPPLGQVWMVLAWPRPPTGERNHDGMLR